MSSNSLEKAWRKWTICGREKDELERAWEDWIDYHERMQREDQHEKPSDARDAVELFVKSIMKDVAIAHSEWKRVLRSHEK